MQCSFVLSQKSILSLLASMQPICNKRTTRDVTSQLLLEVAPRELTIKSTDLEISLQATTEINSDSESVVSFLVSGKRLYDVIKEIEDDITFTCTQSTLKLTSGSVDLSLNIEPAADFPPFPERIENLMHIDAPYLVSLLNKVSFLVPQNNAHTALNGLYLEIDDQCLSFVATDGHCLARVTTSRYTLTEKQSWLMPKRAVLELKKIIETNMPAHIFLGVCGNQLVFSGANFNFFTKLIAENYPQYGQILHKNDFSDGIMDRTSFLRTLKRTGSLLAGQFIATSFGFSQNQLMVSIENKEVGSLTETLAITYAGEAVQTRFYTPYLLNGLQVMDDDKVNFSIKNSIKPLIFFSETGDITFTYLVMPVSHVQNAS